MSLRRFFVLVACVGVILCSSAYTLVQTWRDFGHEKAARMEFQSQISEMLANSLREPLIQGSSVEAGIRVQSFLKRQPQVVCLSVEGREVPGASCEGKDIQKKGIFITDNSLFYDAARERSFAKMSVFYDNSDLYSLWKQKLRDSLVVNFLISILIFSLVGVFAARFIRNDLQAVLDESNPERQGKQTSDSIRIREFSRLFQELKKYMSAARFNAESQASAEVAKQVAHDIRSPLAAIRMAIESLDSVGEDKRRAIQSAFERINDISNDLMNRWPSFRKGAAMSEDSSEVGVELVNDLIESIISEKRIQYRELSQITLELKTDREAHALFANVSGHKLKRVLSNIIDNSYDAISRQGSVRVSISQEKSAIGISIKDTGKGISASILPKLMKKGSTFGKERGNGLGLYDAKKNIEAWGGTITLESQEGEGTRVFISLPMAREPEWFARKISFDASATVVSLDDDTSVHDIWKSRFNSVMENFEDFRFLTFSSTSEFTDWLSQEEIKNCLFLIDYEFLNQKLTGLDLIEGLKIQRHSILVTSRYSEPIVSQRAQDLNVSILPKNLAGFIPVEVSA
jgi:signal transduction histidine kinase